MRVLPIHISDKTAYWLIALTAFVFMIPHSMSIWGNGNYPTDICVYYRCAEWINQGLVMYHDMFDHKGPLVYLIYLFFTRFVGVYGIWLMDILIAFCILGLCYRTARIYTNERSSLIITGLMAMYLQLPFTDEGGPEWIASVGCAYTCYILAKHLQDRAYFSFKEIMGLSVAVGICLLTKANTSAGIIPVALYILYHLVSHWDAQVFGRYIAAVLAGLGIVFVPVFGWMYYQGNISDFIDCYLIFNTQGYGEQADFSRTMGLVTMSLICLPGFIFYILFVRYTYQNDKPALFWISLTFFFSVILNAFTKNCYQHYAFPCFCVFALLLGIIWDKSRLHKGIYSTIVSLCVLIGVVTFGVRVYHRLLPLDCSHDQETASFLNTHRGDSEYVMVYGVEDRSMWSFKHPVFNFHYRLWLLLDGKPASRYFYHPLGMSQSLERLEESWQMIRQHAPLWIVAHEQNSQDIIHLGYNVYSQDEYGYQILKRQQ